MGRILAQFARRSAGGVTSPAIADPGIERGRGPSRVELSPHIVTTGRPGEIALALGSSRRRRDRRVAPCSGAPDAFERSKGSAAARGADGSDGTTSLLGRGHARAEAGKQQLGPKQTRAGRSSRAAREALCGTNPRILVLSNPIGPPSMISSRLGQIERRNCDVTHPLES